jgi:hypothetical protein
LAPIWVGNEIIAGFNQGKSRPNKPRGRLLQEDAARVVKEAEQSGVLLD